MQLKLILSIILSFFLLTSCRQSSKKNSIKPIGYFVTDYNSATGAPRQGRLVPENSGKIIIDSLYIDGLHDLDEFEYIIVLYWFDKVESWSPEVNPPESAHKFGVFATRSPKRPNPVGFSVLRLDSLKYNVLYISGVDAFNGTPVIDIKPFLPSVDIVESAKNIAAEIELGHHNEKYIRDSIFWK
jgi:tRNA-Thr(GGU) m(6)t(6)A37 methyltransferase TsaA